MSDLRNLVNAQVGTLIAGHFVCLDAAAEAINDRLGGSVCKGTLSKRRARQAGWPIDEVMALEDAAHRFPVTRMMMRRVLQDAGQAETCLIEGAGAISKEAGEAVAAILAAHSASNSQRDALAVAEIDEAIEALRRAREALTGGG